MDIERPAADLQSEQVVSVDSDDGLTPIVTPRYSLPNTPRGKRRCDTLFVYSII